MSKTSCSGAAKKVARRTSGTDAGTKQADGPSPKFVESVQRLSALLGDTDGSDRALKDLWPTLKGVKSSLDSGRAVSGAGPGRGLPLWLVIQTLKCSWHHDETWPVDSEVVASKTTSGPGGAQAIVEPGPPVRPDPSPDQVAEMYRRKGIAVAEPDPSLVVDDW